MKYHKTVFCIQLETKKHAGKFFINILLHQFAGNSGFEQVIFLPLEKKNSQKIFGGEIKF
jgi:hypothetical protein